jgi:integrase
MTLSPACRARMDWFVSQVKNVTRWPVRGVVQEMLGHSDIRVTRGYTHVSSLLAQDAAARVGRALFGETATKDHDP